MRLTREQLIERVSSQMPAKRWRHTLGVMQSAIWLAELYGADPERAELAAIVHDVAKYWPVHRQAAVIAENGLNADLLRYDAPLWHSEVGAYVAEHEYGIDDREVVDAIRYHTSGREGMTLLDKVVCLADYIEPGRDFPGVDTIREKARLSLEEGLIAGFDSTLRVLVERSQMIFPTTVLARNDLIRLLAEREQAGQVKPVAENKGG
ncbi:bis(5'-nucleosyl)-tetraphosphatase (symmetrical) YqeK [Saccharibacillus sp. CPCC 101409]|uniref:bis(5'-nucleosyl)-tetraphosphatase (symmetrical) YqeK n=1 Tax=Saccharibacillus sp. CPCC 101409 TaxID=3058041 RepID=UPI0026732E9B|nr:bis(5'-nucleosyl)-tetraphosphatase (symmetrical) YqeK [Saccharibacillus sp. CPCC 101409]MDO3409087.1 bis(5'-nucleosyl)-tetraphosphatase (symmetrical) YqeK [Saccharibacillus sp. CPCC 101409]